MTDSDKSFKEVKFHIFNFVLFLLVLFVNPFLGFMLSVMLYLNHPSGMGEYNYIINPFMTIIPIIYLFLTVNFLIKKYFLRAFFIFVFGLFILFELLVIHGNKEIKNDYLTLFEKVGIIKK